MWLLLVFLKQSLLRWQCTISDFALREHFGRLNSSKLITLSKRLSHFLLVIIRMARIEVSDVGGMLLLMAD